MAKESSPGQMEAYLKENSFKIKFKAMGFTFGVMVDIIRDSS